MSAGTETYQFQAETKQLLEIMINALYTSKEIFLRELISNASDAIDRLRFEALTRPELTVDNERFEIILTVNKNARTLTISDNGIGMSREDVIANIGTIARSGTRELREKVKESPKAADIAQLIGQFGVGFYSAFMVADKVTLVTRRVGEQGATKWESTGDWNYTVTAVEKAERGTSITLHLKPVDTESGIEDFTDRWVLSRVVKRHSDFVGYPIIFKDELSETDKAAEEALNSMQPIWTRPQSTVTDEEYAEFYKHISSDWQPPLKTIYLKAEGRLEYQALLFIPSVSPPDLYYVGSESGLRLYAKRVMIMERCEDLLPHYLRFIKGIVDSADLPLNISRQMLQQDRHITQMRKWLTKKILDTLQDLKEKDNERYLKFWDQFGRAFKEGVSSDFDNKEKVVSLLLFESSHSPDQLTSLQDYKARMKPEQNEIFYLTGESRSVVENSPHLEAFQEKGYEVLYLVDPVDELVVQALTEFDGKKLKSVGKGVVELGSDEEKARAAKELEQMQADNTELLDLLQKKLDTHVKQVRLSNRLTKSPACLVGGEHDYSPLLERLLSKGKNAGPKQRRIMELNPQHRIFAKLKERFQRDKEDASLADYAELLFGYALLAEGSELPDPVRFNQLVANLIELTL